MIATRRPLPPATGNCKWLTYVDPQTGNRWLHVECHTPSGGVTKDDYEVEQFAGGFRLHRLDPETFEVVTYTISTTWGNGVWSCSCPDAANRPERRGQCKHVRALRAALAKLPL